MSFERSLSIKDDMQAEINKEARALSLNILRLLIKQTPVGNPETWVYNHPERGYIDYIGYFGRPDYVGGRARSNWFTNAGLTRSSAITGDTAPDLSIATSKIELAKAKTQDYPTINITNNLPYIERLNRGWSTQAPTNFVDLTIQRVINQ